MKKIWFYIIFGQAIKGTLFNDVMQRSNTWFLKALQSRPNHNEICPAHPISWLASTHQNQLFIHLLSFPLYQILLPLNSLPLTCRINLLATFTFTYTWVNSYTPPPLTHSLTPWSTKSWWKLSRCKKFWHKNRL